MSVNIIINQIKAASMLLIFLSIFSCKRYEDPNKPYYKYLGLQEGQKPLQFERRRVNLDSSLALEILLIYKNSKGAPWLMTILKKKRGEESYFPFYTKEIAESPLLLDRIVIKDFFKDSFNSIYIEFSRYKSAENKDNQNQEKIIQLYRYPFRKGPVLYREIPASLLTEKNQHQKESSSHLIDWEDTNSDGRLELILPKVKTKEKSLEYAYGKMNKYKDMEILKFNGIEFIPFSIDKPFLYFQSVEIPKKIKKGQEQEVFYRISNLGAYSAKIYLTFSIQEIAKLRGKSLKNYGRSYRPGYSIFHLGKKENMRAKYPLVEYTMYPWPRFRTFTFRLSVEIPKRSKLEKLTLLTRYSSQYLNRNIYFPAPDRKDLARDQQGMPAYSASVDIVD